MDFYSFLKLAGFQLIFKFFLTIPYPPIYLGELLQR